MTVYYCSLCFSLADVFVSIIMAISCDWQVSLVSRLKHENVVELIGYCLEGPLRVLAYEYATMGSLHDILHG